MVIIEIIERLLALLDDFLGHFVTGSISSGNYTVTTKGNYLVGAVADTITYGSILVDWISQVLLGNSTAVNAV